MAIQIQLRRGTAAQWTTTDPILAQGEMAVELDTGKYKIGNGTSTWTALPYPSNVGGLDDITDVVATSPSDGSVLVYQTSINKWVASTTLNQQNMDAGEF